MAFPVSQVGTPGPARDLVHSCVFLRPFLPEALTWVLLSINKDRDSVCPRARSAELAFL